MLFGGTEDCIEVVIICCSHRIMAIAAKAWHLLCESSLESTSLALMEFAQH